MVWGGEDDNLYDKNFGFSCSFFIFVYTCVVYQLCLQISYVVLEQFETGVSILFS